MDNNFLLCCKNCGSFLTQQNDQYICYPCSKTYPTIDGIILMEEKGEETNLRIGENLLNIHELRDSRKYYENYIKSNVEYTGRLHSINFSNFHVELLLPYLSNSTILDLGCGQLPYINFFPEEKIKEFYGLDLSQESLVIAARNFRKKFPLILVKHDVNNIPFHDGPFDIVISSEVLEHLDNPKDYLREIYRVTKEGGYLSLSTPCVSIYFYPHELRLIAIRPVGWYKSVNCHKYWNKALSWHPGLRPSILRKWVRETGFSIKRHETRLWYYHTPLRLMWRLFSLIEKLGMFSAGNFFAKYLKFMDTLLASNIPIIKWLGIRQFILCQKRS